MLARCLRWFRDKIRYAKLRPYPDLRGIDRENALMQLKACEREVISVFEPWYNLVRIAMFAMVLTLVGVVVSGHPIVMLIYYYLSWPIVLFFFAGGMFLNLVNRRIRRRLALLAEALRGSQQPDCLFCGYDLCGTPGNHCPECGHEITRIT